VRRLPVIYALILLVLVSACRSQARSQDGPPAADQAAAPGVGAERARPKIVVLGDSLTAGYGLGATQSYPYLLQQKLDTEGYKFEVVNAGVSGDTSAGGLRRLEWALEGDVKVVIVALGGNDGLRGLPVDQMKRNIGEIIRRARERQIVVVLAGMEAPPNYGSEYAAAFRKTFQDLARDHRVPLIPFLLNGVAAEADLNLADGIHPNPRGAAVVSDTVWKALRPVLDQMSTTQ
jgi:acyl-CoA thioesterase-1